MRILLLAIIAFILGAIGGQLSTMYREYNAPVVEAEVKLICWTPFNKMAVYEYEVLPRTPDMAEDDMPNIITSDNWVYNLRDCVVHEDK